MLVLRLLLSDLRGSPRPLKVPSRTVSYHLAVARALDPALQQNHDAADPGHASARVTARSLERMNDLVSMFRTTGRYPSSRSGDAAERSLAAWLRRRRRDTENGRLAPEIRDGLACLPGWQGRPRADADEARWQTRLKELIQYRTTGKDWPRHKATDIGPEHALGVWLHTQRYRLHRGNLDPAKQQALDDAVPGWSTGRTRGRKPGTGKKTETARVDQGRING